MIDTQLIQGEKAMRSAGSFVDIAGSFGKGFDSVKKSDGAGLAKREAAQKNIDNKISRYMGAMDSNIDVTKLTDADRSVVAKSLVEQKDIYSAAASLAATLKPGSKEHTAQVDIMNGVNNYFGNLKTNLDSFELGKANYFENTKDFSKGNNTNKADLNANVYTGESQFKIGEGGNLFFPSENGDVNFKDIKLPFKKDYAASLDLNKMYESVYKSGGFDSFQEGVFRNQLKAMAAKNPDAFKSIAADKLDSYSDYSGIAADLYQDSDKTDEFINQFIEASVGGARNAANEGKAAKKKNEKGRKLSVVGITKNAVKDSDGNIYDTQTLTDGSIRVVTRAGIEFTGDRKALTNIIKPPTATKKTPEQKDAEKQAKEALAFVRKKYPNLEGEELVKAVRKKLEEIQKEIKI